MLTNNFLNLSKVIMLGGYGLYGTLLKMKGVDNREYYIIPTPASNSFPIAATKNLSLSTGWSGWCVGSGSTPASANDYNLESVITSGLSGTVSVTEINDTTNNKIINRISFMITNTSSDNISINEIGWREAIMGSSTLNGGGNPHTCLFYRHVLDETVTLAPTEGITFIIEFYVDIT